MDTVIVATMPHDGRIHCGNTLRVVNLHGEHLGSASATTSSHRTITHLQYPKTRAAIFAARSFH